MIARFGFIAVILCVFMNVANANDENQPPSYINESLIKDFINKPYSLGGEYKKYNIADTQREVIVITRFFDSNHGGSELSFYSNDPKRGGIYYLRLYYPPSSLSLSVVQQADGFVIKNGDQVMMTVNNTALLK